MIEELKKHLTEKQVKEIVSIIIEQYKRYKQYNLMMNTNKFGNLFIEEYSPHKKQHNLSWAISSAFPNGEVIASNIRIECQKYGKGHTRPLLYNGKIKMHILSSTSDFSAKYLREYYENNKDNFGREQLYCYIKFTENKDRLMNISLCLPNADGTIFQKETLLDDNEIQKFAA